MRILARSVVAGLTGIVLGVTVTATSIALADKDSSATSSNTSNLPVQEIEKFTNAITIIKNNYVEPVTDSQLFENAMHGMLSGLDPHSNYLDAQELKDLTSVTQGQFGGIGLEVMQDNGALKVVSPLDDSPAQKAGIKPGDLIVSIDNVPVSSLSLMDAVNKMRGAKGTKVSLLIIRNGEKTPLKVEVTREVIVVKSIKYGLIDGKYAYLRISSFQAPTANDMNFAIDQLKQQAGGQLSGLILDLRNNPGGLLDSAVAVSDAFLDNSKVIVYTKGRATGASFNENATPGDILNGAPIVILINGGTASAAEIVAGALQDEKRALIMGEQSFGKGSVQTVIPLDQNTAVKITTALYYTPNGRSIQAHGITPDITVKNLDLSKSTSVPDDELGIKEANLPGHLQNGNPTNNTTTPVVTSPQSDNNTAMQNNLMKDYQVVEALHLLKGLSVMQKTATATQ